MCDDSEPYDEDTDPFEDDDDPFSDRNEDNDPSKVAQKRLFDEFDRLVKTIGFESATYVTLGYITGSWMWYAGDT